MALEGRFHGMASIKSATHGHICCGVFINSRYILTAVDPVWQGYTLAAQPTVYIGPHKCSDNATTPGVQVLLPLCR